MKKVNVLLVLIGLLVLFFLILIILSNNHIKTFFHQKDSINVNANGEEITKDISISPSSVDSIDLSKKLKVANFA